MMKKIETPQDLIDAISERALKILGVENKNKKIPYDDKPFFDVRLARQ